MKAFFGEPVVRLFLRALVAGGVAFASKFLVFDPSGAHISYQSAALTSALVGGLLAFSEVFTPLNSIVGVLKPPIVAPAKPPAVTVAAVVSGEEVAKSIGKPGGAGGTVARRKPPAK